MWTEAETEREVESNKTKTPCKMLRLLKFVCLFFKQKKIIDKAIIKLKNNELIDIIN